MTFLTYIKIVRPIYIELQIFLGSLHVLYLMVEDFTCSFACHTQLTALNGSSAHQAIGTVTGWHSMIIEAGNWSHLTYICSISKCNIPGFHCHTIIKTIQQIKSRIKETKEDEYSNSFSKIQGCAMFRSGDIRRNVLLKFIRLCMEAPCLCLSKRQTKTHVIQFWYKKPLVVFWGLINIYVVRRSSCLMCFSDVPGSRLNQPALRLM